MAKSKNELPPGAKLVFKGTLFEVWQWEQKMFDGTVETFEKLKRPDTALVIPAVGDKILIQKEEQPHSSSSFLSLPGGRIEAGENPLDAARRELLEETGCASDDWELWKTHSPVSKMIWTIYVFIARGCRFLEPASPDSGEKIETRMITFEEFLELAENPDFYEPELNFELIKAKLNAEYRGEFKKLLFG